MFEALVLARIRFSTKFRCDLCRSLESSSSSTTATPVASSNNGSWEEAATAAGSSSAAMRGGRGQSFFPVRGGRGGAQLYTAGSIAPPNFSFRPGVSGEMLL